MATPVLGRALVLERAGSSPGAVELPDPALLDLPERAVQFGTGAFLRGFVDAFLDDANRRGAFGGRVVAIGSTRSGRDAQLNAQDGLYTLCSQGVEDGRAVRTARVIASVSRALSAASAWDRVLACARNPALALIFSNTTEVGIALDASDRPMLAPPRSFPGKLARFLMERGRAFDWDPAYGVTVLPCELIEHNGARLRDIVLALADEWRAEARFAEWIEAAVPFCDTLVDRIVPGAPAADDAASLEASFGYHDAMLTTCERYRLFAIAGDDALAERLGFARGAADIVVAPDIAPYRLRKVRLLNGAHTAIVSTALLCGCETVAEAVADPAIGALLRSVLLDEIVPTLDVPGAAAFARDVLERFANPYIRHALIDITLQGTMKMRVRVVPSIVEYAARFGRAPASLAFGFAGYLEFMRGVVAGERRDAGITVPADDHAAMVRAHWEAASSNGIATVVNAVCSDTTLWGTDLTEVPGFTDAVTGHLVRLGQSGAVSALEAHLAEVSAWA